MIPGVKDILRMLLANERSCAQVEAWIREHIRLAENSAAPDTIKVEVRLPALDRIADQLGALIAEAQRG